MCNDIYKDCGLEQICPTKRKHENTIMTVKKYNSYSADEIVEIFYNNIGTFSVFTTNNEGIIALKKTFNKENDVNYVFYNNVKYIIVIEEFNDVYCSYSLKKYDGRIKEIYSSSYATYRITFVYDNIFYISIKSSKIVLFSNITPCENHFLSLF